MVETSSNYYRMKITLIGTLGSELERAGLKPGDEVEATRGSELTGSMYFETWVDNRLFSCVVWPENYIINDID